MQPLRIIEEEVTRQTPTRFVHRFVGMKINFLVLHRPPKPLDEDVVEHPAAAVHRNPDALRLEPARKFRACVLPALVAVENLRPRDPQRSIKSRQTELFFQENREFPSQDIATEPVHDRGQKHETMRQTNIGDVRGPNLIRTANLKMVKKIGVDPIQRLRLARVPFGINRRDPHDPHQAFDSLMIDLIPFSFQDLRHPRRSVKRRLHVLLVDQPHQVQVQSALAGAFVVIG